MPRERGRRRSSQTGRALLLLGLSALIVGAAVYLAQPKEQAFIEIGPQAAVSAEANAPFDATLRIDMGGFTPPDLELPAGRPIRLRIVNPDNSHHSDGGGVHGFAIEALGVDVRVPPLTTMVITIPAAPAGEYAFYCDTCCGGKENPSMNGVVRMTA